MHAPGLIDLASLIFMACNNPNKVFYIGFDPVRNKHEIAFTSRKYDHVVVSPNGTFSPGYGFDVKNSQIGEVFYESQLVPCGQCIGCRLDRARAWATRCMLEKKSYPDNEVWFVTLTYDDDFLPEPIEVLDDVTGELRPGWPSLQMKDHQNFMKSLRKAVDKRYPGKKLRFFGCGEYGSSSFRPHYHYIIYGLPLDDLVFYKSNFRGDIYYNSPFLESIWKKGFVVVSTVNTDTCQYVARYITKKHLGKDSDVYSKFGIAPEFSVMSRKPGIASTYFENNFTDLLITDNVVIPSYDGSIVTSLPRYFETVLERIDKVKYSCLKDDRARSAELQHDTLVQRRGPTFDEEDIFDTRERDLFRRTLRLKKGDI